MRHLPMVRVSSEVNGIDGRVEGSVSDPVYRCICVFIYLFIYLSGPYRMRTTPVLPTFKLISFLRPVLGDPRKRV